MVGAKYSALHGLVSLTAVLASGDMPAAMEQNGSGTSLVGGAMSMFSSLFRPEVPKPQVGMVHTIPLRKQYVPVVRNGSTLAYKTTYFGDIYVGGPKPQPYSVVFDTGSGHLILPSRSCTSETCMKHRRYASTDSSTGVDIEHDGSLVPSGLKSQQQVRISFGTGEISGEFVKEQVCLSSSPTDCTNMRVVLATTMTAEPFSRFDFDGVLGLGTTALALNENFNFFGQMVQSQPSMQHRFAVYLAKDDAGQSAISFGGHQEQTAASEIKWAPVARPELGYWQVNVKQIRIGGQVLNECGEGKCRAILDTGTSLLGVPRFISRTMHRMLARPVPGDGANVDCRHVEGADLEFDLGDFVITMKATDISRPKPYNMTANTPEGWRMWCRSLLLPVDMQEPLGPDVFILGEPLLRKYLTIYDWAKKQVGFSVAGLPPIVHHDGGPTAIDAPPSDSMAAGTNPSPLANLRGADGASEPSPQSVNV